MLARSRILIYDVHPAPKWVTTSRQFDQARDSCDAKERQLVAAAAAGQARVGIALQDMNGCYEAIAVAAAAAVMPDPAHRDTESN